MKKYLILVTISLVLIVTTILTGLVLRPTAYLDTGSQSPASSKEGDAGMPSSVSYGNHSPATLFPGIGDNSPVIYLNLPAELDSNIEYSLINAPVAPNLTGGQSAICTYFDTPAKVYSTLQEQAALSYWQEVKLWLTPAEAQVTLWQPNQTSSDYILVSSDIDQPYQDCPILIDEDV